MYIVYDILYLNGPSVDKIVEMAFLDCKMKAERQNKGSILHFPLAVRRKLLEKVYTPQARRVEIIKHIYVSEKSVHDRLKKLKTFYEDVVCNKGEGVVVKDVTAKYSLGAQSRNTGHWCKIKPDYSQNADYDMIVLGAKFGDKNNSTRNFWSSFICGVKKSAEEDTFHPVCSVASGLSHEELSMLWESLPPAAKLSRDEMIKRGYFGEKDPIAHEYFNPHESFVFQLKVTEFIHSHEYSCNITARFPRVERIREKSDKGCESILTLAELIELQHSSQNPTDSYGGVSKAKSKFAHKERKFVDRSSIVDERFHVSVTSNTDETNLNAQFFAGLSFHIADVNYSFTKHSRLIRSKSMDEILHKITGNKSKNTEADSVAYGKKNISEIIQSHGGKLVANAVSGSLVVVNRKAKYSLLVSNIIEKGEVDVIDVAYIFECVSKGKLVPQEIYFIRLSKATLEQQLLGANKDSNFIQETEIDKLRSAFVYTDQVLLTRTDHDLKYCQTMSEMAKLLESSKKGSKRKIATTTQDWVKIKKMSKAASIKGKELLCTKILLQEDQEKKYIPKEVKKILENLQKIGREDINDLSWNYFLNTHQFVNCLKSLQVKITVESDQTDKKNELCDLLGRFQNRKGKEDNRFDDLFWAFVPELSDKFQSVILKGRLQLFGANISTSCRYQHCSFTSNKTATLIIIAPTHSDGTENYKEMVPIYMNTEIISIELANFIVSELVRSM